MSVLLSWPATLRPQRFALRLSANNRRFASPYSGGVQVLDLVGERWVVEMQVRPATRERAQALEALLASLRGQDGRVSLGHLARPHPLGTLRGSPTLSAAVAQGAQSLAVAGSSGTLKAGDLLGLAGQLLMVAQDTTVPGTVSLANRLRAAAPSGTALVWDRPTAQFRLADDEGGGPLDFGPGGVVEPLELSWVESF